MWNFHKLTVFIETFFFFAVADAIIIKNEHSLFGPYEAGGSNLAHWDLTGSAQLAQNVIRLTTDEPGKHGSIWNNYPTYSNNWELHLQFHIHGKGVNLNGDGMAVWYVKDILHSGPVFGYKDYFSGLGVFIDTFENPAVPHKHRHPYISAMVNNGTFRYDHDKDGTATQVGGCHLQVRNLEWITKLAVAYVSNTLTVYVDGTGQNMWIECFRAPGVHLPTGYHFGISASTGEHSDNHDVVSITGLDMTDPEKQFEDKSHVIPFAEHIQIPPKYHRQIVEDSNKEKHEAKDAAEEDTVQSEEIPATASASFMRKLIYIFGIGVILFVAVSTWKKYSTMRRERMQKRLF